MSSSPAPAGLRASRFDAFDVLAEFVRVLQRRGITEPLPIQALCVPDALTGRDVCGKAPTGSGKTLAFALPMAARLGKARPKRPTGLVLAPTRELAAQIAGELAPLAAVRGLRVHAFYGGVGYSPQLKALRGGIEIAVACPGRLEDLMAGGHVVLDEVTFVVVDEADRMADMGFLPAVRRVLDATSADRQTLLFSATLDGDVDVLVRRYQKHPVRHEVDGDEDVSRMTHRFHYVAHDERVATCARLINDTGSAIVFVRTRHGADRLVRQLGKLGVVAAAIHGDRSQAQRERALHAFSSGSVRALVATDVAARGIHVDDVSCVIHFDLSEDAKDYVHRAGRTARAGAEGVSIALVTHEHRVDADRLRAALKLSPEMVGDVPRRAPERPAPSQQARPSHSSRGGQGRRRGAGTRSRTRT